MSTAPKASTPAATSLSATSGLVRSPAKTAVSPSISPAACSATSASRSLISTLAPSRTNISAVARPIPRADPVTIAAFPSRSPIALSVLLLRSRNFGSEAIWNGRWLTGQSVPPHADGPIRPVCLDVSARRRTRGGSPAQAAGSDGGRGGGGSVGGADGAGGSVGGADGAGGSSAGGAGGSSAGGAGGGIVSEGAGGVGSPGAGSA